MRHLFAAISLASLACFATMAHAADAEKFEADGTVETGMMAIGGETTGTEFKTEKGNYELAAANPLVAKQIAALNGKRVHIVGTLSVKAGVEVKERRVVTVTAITLLKPE